jgi:mRNA-degrading endonuclease RelE of RelBE toxin-antitoxin system
VGDWRIIFTIREAQLVVVVIEVDARGSVYRQL